MPVPGSLRKRAIDENQIADLLSNQFALPRQETFAYLKLLETTDLTLDQLSSKLGSSLEDTVRLVDSMIRKGLIIEGTGSKKLFSPLHPRMTLTNIFKVYEKELVQTLRERRATADRVVNLLIPLYEERETKMPRKSWAS